VLARLEWGEGNGREVRGVEELDHVLDELEREAADEPFLVELSRNGGASLSLGLGRRLTALDYVPADLNPPYYQSYAPGVSRDSLWFRFRGEASEFAPEAAVSAEAGRRALRHFLLTGDLTPELSWQET